MKTKRRSKRIIAFILAAITAASAASCSAGNGNAETAPPADSITEPGTDTLPSHSSKEDELTSADKARNRLSPLFNRDMKGETFFIATPDDVTVCPFGESDDKIILARADSRDAAEEKYNLSIITVNQTSAEIFEAAKSAVNSGMYYADLLAIPNSELGKFYAAGLLANMNSLPHTDYSADYYYGSAAAAATIGYDIYGVFGAASFNPDYLSAVYFNKDIAERCLTENLYDLVREGKWTFDKYAELNLAAEAADGNIFGHTSSLGRDAYLERAISAFGIEYVNNNPGEAPVLSFMEGDEAENPMITRATSAVDTLSRLFYSDKTFADLSVENAQSYFIDGAALFNVNTLDFAAWISDSPVNWGLLPMPKYSEESEYISPLGGDAPIFCVLKNTPSYEASGLVLEALNAAAYDYTLEAYIEDRIHYRLRDGDSIEMLRLICGNPTVDFTTMFASGFKHLDNATYKAVFGGVTTRSTLKNLYRQYRYYASSSLEKGVTVYQ